MKNYAIRSGNFTTNGNFSGYTALGERLFVHKTQMAALGLTKNEDLVGKFPLFAIGAVKMIGQLNEDGTPKLNADGTPVQVERLQALSIFSKKEDMVAAHVDVATLDIEIKSAIKSSATSAGLTEKAVDALLAAAV